MPADPGRQLLLGEQGWVETLEQQLSASDQEILRLIALGRTNAAIGAELHLSPGTVKNRITGLLRKLGAADRAQAAARAGEIGLTERFGE